MLKHLTFNKSGVDLCTQRKFTVPLSIPLSGGSENISTHTCEIYLHHVSINGLLKHHTFRETLCLWKSNVPPTALTKQGPDKVLEIFLPSSLSPAELLVSLLAEHEDLIQARLSKNIVLFIPSQTLSAFQFSPFLASVFGLSTDVQTGPVSGVIDLLRPFRQIGICCEEAEALSMIGETQSRLIAVMEGNVEDFYLSSSERLYPLPLPLSTIQPAIPQLNFHLVSLNTSLPYPICLQNCQITLVISFESANRE